MLGRTPMKTRSTTASRDGKIAAGSTRSEIGCIDGSQHCKACTDEDNTRMVQCDKCDDWYHFECVEVSQGVATRDWQCPCCMQATQGARKKSSAKVTSVEPAVSTSASVNPSIRVTSVPLTIVPQIPSSLPALPQQTTSDNVNDSMLTHVPSNIMFPPMPANKASNIPNPPNVFATSTFFAPSMLMPPSIFTLAGGTVPFNPLPTPSNPLIQSTICSSNAFPEMASIRQCLPVSSGHPPRPAVVNIPLASSTIIPTTGLLVGQPSNEPLKSTLEIPRNNAKQGFGETSSQHSGASRRSTKQRQLELELKMLDEERKLQEEEDAKKRAYLQKRYALLLEIASETSSIVGAEDGAIQDRVDEWINNGMDEGQRPDQPGPNRELLDLNVAAHPASRNVHQCYAQTDIVNDQRRNALLPQPRTIPTATRQRNFDIPSSQPTHGSSNHPMMSNLGGRRPSIDIQLNQRSRVVNSPGLGRSSFRRKVYDDDAEGNNLTRSQLELRFIGFCYRSHPVENFRDVLHLTKQLR
nr:uncharacterized protein LOC115259208 [Aedes albopictus]